MTADLRGSRVLVTGAAGFIGEYVCHALKERGAEVIPVVHREPSSEMHDSAILVVDLTDREAVRAAIRGAAPDRIVHLAALKRAGGIVDFRPSYEANLLGTLNLAEAVIDVGGCTRFVYLSSAEEYGRAPIPFEPGVRERPLTAYGLSKLAATQLLQALATTHALPIAILRATLVYGPIRRSGIAVFLPALVRALVIGNRFPMSAGEQTRDLVYIDDVVDGILRALVMPERYDKVLNLGAGAPVSIRDLALLAARLVGPGVESLIEFGAVPYRDGEAMEYWASNAETKAVLGWAPRVSLEEGLRRVIEDYRASSVGI